MNTRLIYCLAQGVNADEVGAAFIDYSALLGCILAVGLATVTLVGKWASTQWANVSAKLGSN